MSLRTEYDFVLPRGYVDDDGSVHREGTMRLATARDELAPLRDPIVQGPDDPRITVLVLARVITRLGDLSLITTHEIEGLFAVDLAFLQDFYGVINFGTQEEYEALLAQQSQMNELPTPVDPKAARPAPAAEPVVVSEPEPEPAAAAPKKAAATERSRRSAIQEMPAGGR